MLRIVDLPQPGVADHAGELALLDAEPQVLEHGELAAARRLGEAPGQALDADEGLAHGRHRGPRVPSPLWGRDRVRGIAEPTSWAPPTPDPSPQGGEELRHR